MLEERYKSLSAVFPVLLREVRGETQVLLNLRAGTNFMDGWWDFAGSGHVEQRETATQAVCRECAEEMGIDIKPENVQFLHLAHRVGVRAYYDVYFQVLSWDGEPTICEPDKCAQLKWFPVNRLPPDMIPYRRRAMKHWMAGNMYSEIVE